MPRPLTLKELEGMTCQVPGCAHRDHSGGMFLNSRCHQRGVEVEFLNRVLHIRCYVCKRPVADVAVDPGILRDLLGGKPSRD